MTSPIKDYSSTRELSPIKGVMEGERLSPIKLSTDIINHSNNDVENLSPTTLLGKHPHGLSSKQVNKRNTIYEGKPLVDTPVANKTMTASSVTKRVPLTSPRTNVNPNLESLKKSKQQLDAKLLQLKNSVTNSPRTDNLDKENNNGHDDFMNHYVISSPQFENSSPVNSKKRTTADTIDTPNKATKVNSSIRVDEVFHKEDLVTSLSNSNSPQKVNPPNGNGSSPRDERRYQPPPSDIHGETLQTSPIKLNVDEGANPSISNNPNHDLHDDNNNDDADDADDDNADDNDDNAEPTTKFLVSPRSKPVFTMEHVKRIQTKHYTELENLEAIINSKNQEILNFSEELSSTNSKFLQYDKIIKDLKLSRQRVVDNEELLMVQLEHNDQELNGLNKKLKSKLHQIQELENKLSQNNETTVQLTRDVEQKSHENDDLKSQVEQLKQLNETGLIEKSHQLDEKIKELTEKDEHISQLNQTITESNGKNGELNEIIVKQEELLNELETQLNSVRLEVNRSQQKVDEMGKKNEELREEIGAINREKDVIDHERQQSLNEVNNLKSVVEEKDQEIMQLQNASGDSNTKLSEELENKVNEVNELKEEVTKLINQCQEKETVIQQNQQQIESNRITDQEKDEIIKGDTKSMGEMTDKINELKQTISSLEKQSIGSLEKQTNEETNMQSLKEQIEEYKRLNEENRQKTNTKIQEIAEQLYKEYSKKHEFKVDQLKTNFKVQLEQLRSEKKNQRKDIESLQKKIELISMEKEQLLRLTKKPLPPKMTKRPQK